MTTSLRLSFLRLLLVFGAIILANVIDQILGMGGAITYAIVIFYIANEGNEQAQPQ
ncbi:phage holin family protein [Paenisporosarcina indica]|uniref:phage holin family protein n=1 Tax=Paenisporosarcina indica TaxID=650093 RepID=UPI000AA39C8F|nr:phage holin family protein [Paenisporosarcina indica]